MPTYQYRCTECGTELEAFQKFTDAPLTVCPSCQGALRKVYGSVGVVFKGSGFYVTDNRSKSSSHPTASIPPSESSPAASTSKDAGAASTTPSTKTGAAKTGTSKSGTTSTAAAPAA